MDRKEALEKMIKERVEMNPDIVKQRLHKIWNYFNKMNNIDKRNLKKNVEDGQRLYRSCITIHWRKTSQSPFRTSDIYG